MKEIGQTRKNTSYLLKILVIMLAPTLGERAWNAQNVLTHVVVPIASVIDFFVVCCLTFS